MEIIREGQLIDTGVRHPHVHPSVSFGRREEGYYICPRQMLYRTAQEIESTGCSTPGRLYIVWVMRTIIIHAKSRSRGSHLSYNLVLGARFVTLSPLANVNDLHELSPAVS